MFKEFCTYITIYTGNKLPPFYIGSTSLSRIEKGYCGSVTSQRYKKIWRDEKFYNPHLFKVKIISLHSTREEASTKEVKLQLALNVVNNPLYTNLAIHYNNHVVYTSTRTKEHNQKISKALTGIKRDDEFKRKVSLNHKKRGPVSQETRDKHRKARLGFKLSEETKKKISLNRKGKKIPKESHDKMMLKRMGNDIWKITNPHGEVFFANNLLEWCKQNVDTPRSARSAMSTKHGWKRYYAVRIINM